MFDISVTRWPNGMTNSRDTATLSDMPLPDMTRVSNFTDDFQPFVAANYTITGTPAFAAVAGANGVIQSAISATGSVSMQLPVATFQLTRGLRTWATFVVAVDGLASMALGLVNINTNPTSTPSNTDGMYVRVNGYTTQMTPVAWALAGGTSVSSGTTGAPSIFPPVSMTRPLTVRLYWDGAVYQAAPNGRVIWELSGPFMATPFRASFGGSSAVALPAGFPSAAFLSPTVAIAAPTGGSAFNAQVDLISVITERVSPLATPPF
jgi:hypothetical protein